MSNRCWIAIATIAVAVLGVAVLGVLAPAEHAAHLAAVESGTAGNAESVARIEERIETTGAAVGRIEAKIDTLIQLRTVIDIRLPSASRRSPFSAASGARHTAR